MTPPVSWIAIELRRRGLPPGSADATALLRAVLEIVTRLDPDATGWFVRGRTPAMFAIGEPDALARALALAAPNARDFARGKPSALTARAGNDAEVELRWKAGVTSDDWQVVCRTPCLHGRDAARSLDEAQRALAEGFLPEQARGGVIASADGELGADVPWCSLAASGAAPIAAVPAAVPAGVPPGAAAPARPVPDATLDVQFPLPDTTLPFVPPKPSDETALIGAGTHLAPSEEGFRAALTDTPVPDMSLEQYAAFHVELRLKGALDPSMSLRYGVPSAAVHRALVESYRQRFAADTALAERFAELLRKMSGAYGGGKSGG